MTIWHSLWQAIIGLFLSFGIRQMQRMDSISLPGYQMGLVALLSRGISLHIQLLGKISNGVARMHYQNFTAQDHIHVPTQQHTLLHIPKVWLSLNVHDIKQNITHWFDKLTNDFFGRHADVWSQSTIVYTNSTSVLCLLSNINVWHCNPLVVRNMKNLNEGFSCRNRRKLFITASLWTLSTFPTMYFSIALSLQ